MAEANTLLAMNLTRFKLANDLDIVPSSVV